jgi:hypothetical protein
MFETKTVGSMTDRQRRALAARLGGESVHEDLRDPFALGGLSWASQSN